MIKVLWFSNVLFDESKVRATGTWIHAMAHILLKSGMVELTNVLEGSVKQLVRKDCGAIKQYIVPRIKIKDGDFKDASLLAMVRKIEEDCQPDVIHVWGLEPYWSLLKVNGFFKAPCVVDIQGLLYVYQTTYFGNLTIGELFRCIGLKEIVNPFNALVMKRWKFKQHGKFELGVIRRLDSVSVQSQWVREYVRSENQSCKIHETKIVLRKEFYDAVAWNRSACTPKTIFTSCSGPTSYKGLHVLLRAAAILKKDFPGIQVRIAGRIVYRKFGILLDGYAVWLLGLIRDLGLVENVVWLGPLNADEIIKELQNANCVAIPSFIETYCVALAEAMYLGCPTVASYAGAMVELGTHEFDALFFPINDHVICGSQIARLLVDDKFASELSSNARKTGQIRNDTQSVLETQIQIYKAVMQDIR